jgi:hypothetical protein
LSTLLRVGTGERRQTITDHSRNYSFPLIEIGEYTVTAALKGFKTQTQTGIVVELQQKGSSQLRAGSRRLHRPRGGGGD